MKPRISIIIVIYHSGPLTLLCLWSLKRAGLQQSEVIVIDNGGNEDIVDSIKQHYPFVRFVKNSANEGFGRACNRGMEMASGDLFLLLNPDTIVPENFERNTLQFFKEHPQTGAMGVQMISGDGLFLPESKRSLPTPSASLYRFTGLAHLFPRSPHFAAYYAGHLSPLKEGETEVLSGAFMVVTKSAIDKVGAFDPRFFLYGEDIDLSWRIHQGGFQTWYNPNIKIIHLKGESTTKDSRQARIFYKAMHQFYQKHFRKQYPAPVTFTVLTAIRILTVLSALKQRLLRHPDPKIPPTLFLSTQSAPPPHPLRNSELPFHLHLPNPKEGQKGTKATLLNTQQSGPDIVIRMAEQCRYHRQKLLIYHPVTNHLFLFSDKNTKCQIFEI